jgi:hypothetical protein
MGWWQSRRNPDDVLGDGPADDLEDALARLSEDPANRPTFEALLGHLAALLRDEGGLTADSGSYHGQPLRARFEPPASDLVAAPRTDRADLLGALRRGIRDISREYEREVSRKPRLSEILETVVFVLAVRPEMYVAEAEGLSLVEINPVS